MGFFDKKKPAPKPDFGKVTSGSDSTLGKTPAQPVFPPLGSKPETPAGQAKTYEVQSGDSLSKIAKRVYGNANEWPKIYNANRDQIKDPDLIHPVQKLILPD
jgi:nucleoid-associated protein YgaU